MLGKSFDESSPLFLQIKARIEEQVMQGILEEEAQIPSTTQIVQFYKINHITVAKGIKLLVDEGIIYKKRGIGMFVAKGARQKLKTARKSTFVTKFVVPLVREAHNIGIESGELLEIVKEVVENENIEG